MIDQLLSPEVQSFIREHESSDPHQLLLKYKTILNLPSSAVVDQIIGKRKAKEKFPSWFAKEKILYPPSINIEQSSSEVAANFKANMIKKEHITAHLDLRSGLDLSGGYGVDSYFFSHVFRDLIVLEPNGNLLDIAQHNHGQLRVSNIKYFNVFAEQFLNSSDRKFDFIYADPSRRSKENRKLISLAQCEPNIISCQDEIWNATNSLLIKTSPLLDIQKGIKELRYVSKVIVLSVGNECKELLFFCKKGFEHEPTIEAVDLHENYSFSFKVSEEHGAEIIYDDPLKYIYEPNASILKSGGFKTMAKIFPVFKLHPNTHLYTSDILIKNFPGRTFELESTVKLERSSIKKNFPDGKANVTTRNYPLSAEQLKKKAGLKDGGEKYLIGLTGTKKKLLIAVRRIF